MTPLTIVMYHYVRPLSRTRYPDIKALDLALFDRQLDFLQRHYVPVSMEEVVAALNGGAALPRRSVLLTFDDGYLDHFTYVLPRLVARGFRGAFYPPAQAVLDRRVLDVNKVHFVLASSAQPAQLVASIEQTILDRAQEFGLESLEWYRERFHKAGRYDQADVTYVKRLLQHALPESLRTEVAGALFAEHVTADELAFAETLYVSVEQLSLMVSCGQHVGSHGNAHYWLGRLAAPDQRADISTSIRLLDAVGAPAGCRTMCYPYGDYNSDTLELMAAMGFRAAVTTRPELARLSTATRYELPRLDTNDLPKSSTAEPNHWTLAADKE